MSNETNPYAAPSEDVVERELAAKNRRETVRGVVAVFLLGCTTLSASVAAFALMSRNQEIRLARNAMPFQLSSWALFAIVLVPVCFLVATFGLVHYQRRTLGAGLLMLVFPLLLLAAEVAAIFNFLR